MELLLQKISDIYGLQLHHLRKVEEGFLTDNHVLADGMTKYFLKKYRFKNVERIIEIHSAKKYFSNGGIPVIMPINTKGGDSFFEQEGSFYALFPFIEDRQLKDDQITNQAIISLAETLAKIHLLGRDAKIAVSDSFKMWDRDKRLSAIDQILEKIRQIENKSDFDIRAEKNVLFKKNIIESKKEEYESLRFTNDHLIHGDYMLPNVFFDKNDNVSYVFDFEKTQYAPRFFELFRAMIYSTMSDKEVTESAIARTKLFLDSYLKIYPAAKEELVYNFEIYYLKQIHSVWVEEEHYLRNNSRVDELLKSDIIRGNYLANNIEYLKSYLFS